MENNAKGIQPISELLLTRNANVIENVIIAMFFSNIKWTAAATFLAPCFF